jgi:hypothetical protein
VGLWLWTISPPYENSTGQANWIQSASDENRESVLHTDSSSNKTTYQLHFKAAYLHLHELWKHFLSSRIQTCRLQARRGTLKARHQTFVAMLLTSRLGVYFNQEVVYLQFVCGFTQHIHLTFRWYFKTHSHSFCPNGVVCFCEMVLYRDNLTSVGEPALLCWTQL